MKMRNILIGLAILGLVCFWGWVLTALTSGRSVFSSILPGLSYTAPGGSGSVNIELVAEVLSKQRRTEIGSDQANYTWNVMVPRTLYVGKVDHGDRIDDGRNVSLQTLFAIYDEKVGSFVPADGLERRQQNNATYINLTNQPASQRLIASRQCLRDIDIHRFSGRGDKDWGSSCVRGELSIPRCHVRSQYKGWNVEISMPKTYYFGDYNAYCNKITLFIDSITTSIQPMLTRKSK